MSRAGTFVYRFSLLNINKYSGTGYSKYSTDMANSNQSWCAARVSLDGGGRGGVRARVLRRQAGWQWW